MIRELGKGVSSLTLSGSNSAPATANANLFTFDYASSYFSPIFAYTMSTLQESLLNHLNADGVSESGVVGALEEFAWTSILNGKRVRDYCDELSEVLSQVHRQAQVRELLNIGTPAVLFPFIRVTSPYFPASPPFPPLLIPTNSLPNITRKQIIESLAKLSRQTHLPKDSLYTESLVFEVLLEYIGRKWNTEQDDLVEVVARKLTEIEFEVQMQGDLPTVRSTIHPALQKARFLLGFLSSAQLVVRLNASSYTSIPASDRVRPDPETLIRAFITRRLAKGVDPTLIVLDLTSIQSRLNSASHKSLMISIVESFGLRSDTPAPTEFGANSPPVEPPSPTPTSTSFGPTISPRRATFSRLANKWATASRRPIAAAAPRWLSHRKNYSYSAKVAAPGFNPDRRPSLPTLPSVPMPGAFAHIKSPLCGSTTSFHTPPETVSEDSQEWEDIGADRANLTKDELLQRLLHLRYRTTQEGGWYLGKSKVEARALLSRRTLGVEIIEGLRDLFGVPPSVSSLPQTPTGVSTPPPTDMPASEPVSPPQPPSPKTPCLTPLSPGSDTGELLPRGLISPISIASFDLEEYYARIASNRSSHAPKLSLASISTSIEHSSDSQHTFTQGSYKARRRSTGVESLLSDTTHHTGFTYERRSRMSVFSIRQATKEWPLESKAYFFELAAHAPLSQDESSDHKEDEEQEILQPAHRYTRSRSETDLLALIDRESVLSPLPVRPTSLRRTRKFDPVLQKSLSAYRLGNPPDSLPVPGIPDVRFQSASEDANHTQMSIRSLMLSGMGRPPLSPPLSPESSVFNTPRPGAFPLPPDGEPSHEHLITPGQTGRAGHSHRQYTVINGEVSPSRFGHTDLSTDYFDLPKSSDKLVSSLPETETKESRDGSDKSRTSTTSSRKSRDKALPVPPRTSSLSQRQADAILSSSSDTPLSLALSLFDISKLPAPPQPTASETHVITPKRELTVNDVNIVLGDMVDSEKARIKSRGKQWDDAARCRVGWLMDQVGDLLNDPRFSPIIDVHLDRLAPASLKNLNLSPASSTGSTHRSPPRVMPVSPLLSLNPLLHVEEDDNPPVPQSSPRPPPRPLTRVVSPAPAAKPLLSPVSPLGKAPTRPLPMLPRTRIRNIESRSSAGSRRESEMSVGTFGH